MTLTEFLLARIAEDEAELRRDGWRLRDWDDDLPSRLLAECEAKRRIVDRFASAAEWSEVTTGHPEHYRLMAGVVLDDIKEFASVYADHPDYRNEWRP